MARTIHLFVVVSGFAMMAEGFAALFYKPAWMVQQNAITLRGLLAAAAFGFAIALIDYIQLRVRKSIERRQPSEVYTPPAVAVAEAATGPERSETKTSLAA